MMSIVIDENISPSLARFLCRKYNAILPRRGSTDLEVLELALSLDAYILSRDRHFPPYEKLIYCKSSSWAYVDRLLKRYGL